MLTIHNTNKTLHQYQHNTSQHTQYYNLMINYQKRIKYRYLWKA